MDKKPLELLIEPVIKKKFTPKFLTKKLPLATSLKKTKIALRVTSLNTSFLGSLKLKIIEVSAEKFTGYFRSYNKQLEIDGLEHNKGKESETFEIVFPYEGIFWLDVKVDAGDEYDVRTTQMTLEGEKGRGEPKDKNGNLIKNICRNGIIAKDILAVRLAWLTFGLLVLTALLVFLTFRLILN